MTDMFSIEDQRRIELGLSIREKIMTDLTRDGRLPSDESSREFLLRAIEGVDATILKRTKIRNEDKQADAQNQISNNIAELLKRVTVTKNTQGPITDTNLDNSIKVDNKVPGEDSPLVSNENLRDEILSKS